jgi:hypothetical protein
MAWHGMAWHGWHGMAWHGMAWLLSVTALQTQEAHQEAGRKLLGRRVLLLASTPACLATDLVLVVQPDAVWAATVVVGRVAAWARSHAGADGSLILGPCVGWTRLLAGQDPSARLRSHVLTSPLHISRWCSRHVGCSCNLQTAGNVHAAEARDMTPPQRLNCQLSLSIHCGGTPAEGKETLTSGHAPPH